MKEIIEQIKEKVKNCDETNKEGRARKGAYIDCITMIKGIRQCSVSGRNAVLGDVPSLQEYLKWVLEPKDGFRSHKEIYDYFARYFA